MSSAIYINFNQPLPIGEDSSGVFSRIKSAGSRLNTTTIIIIVSVLLFSLRRVRVFGDISGPSCRLYLV